MNNPRPYSIYPTVPRFWAALYPESKWQIITISWRKMMVEQDPVTSWEVYAKSDACCTFIGTGLTNSKKILKVYKPAASRFMSDSHAGYILALYDFKEMLRLQSEEI